MRLDESHAFYPMSTSPAMPNDDGRNGGLLTKQAPVPILDERENKTSLEVLDRQPAVETEPRENRAPQVPPEAQVRLVSKAPKVEHVQFRSS